MEEKTQGLSEDWLSVGIGLFVFVLALGVMAGFDLLGWAVKTGTWLEPGKAIRPVSKAYAGLPGILSLLATYGFALAVLSVGALALKANLWKFAAAFTVVFWLSYLCWILGHYAYIAVTTPADMQKFDINWSLRLTGESGYLFALIAGLIVGNLLPSLARWLKEAVRPELYIKIAIVILGGALGIKAAEQLGLATTVMFRGLAAIIEAYLIYWAAVYFVARKWFHFSREWSAPLASGISICGVSAAIATGAAIRARPVVPIMVSSLVVIFAMMELVVLPFLAKLFLANEPMVAGAWMGLAVKTDGAAVASGAITEALIYADAAAKGIHYDKGWLLGVTTTVKIFIDIFIGIWAFLLAYIWTTRIEAKKGEKPRAIEIWYRFPKFVLGFVVTFILILSLGLGATPDVMKQVRASMGEADVFRQLFFALTFFSIGVMSNFKQLWAEGIGRLAAVYFVALFGFVIWVGLIISWIFFQGIKPPVVAG